MKKTIQFLCITLPILFLGYTSGAQIIFKETFDNVSGPTAGGAGTYSFPAGWLLRNVDNRTPSGSVAYVNEAWERREDFRFSVADSAVFSTSWYSPAGAADDWMWTPEITLPASPAELKWNAVAYDPLYPDGYEVRIMVAPNTPTGGSGVIGNQITNSTILFSTPGESSAWQARNVSLDAYANKTVRIAFRNKTTDGFLLIIDDVVVESTGLAVTVDTQTNIACNGGSTGSATVSATGGVAPYGYVWSPSGGDAATASGLAAGTYTVIATDANGLTGTSAITITEPAVLVATPGQTNVSCYGGSNGSATASVTGGTTSYMYAWSPAGGTGATASGLSAGTYTCIITDANTCTTTAVFTISEPALLKVASITVPTDGTYEAANNLDFIVNYSDNVIVNTTGGTPGINITLNTGGIKQASYISGDGTSALTFRYTLDASDLDPDGISVDNTIILNGATIQNSNGCDALNAINALPSTSGILVLNPVPQTITFNALSNKTYGDADFDANAAASSGLTVSYASSNTAVATIVAGKVHIVGTGTTTVTASQLGNIYYLSATDVPQTFIVDPKGIVVTAETKNKVFGETDPALSYTVSPALINGDALSGAVTRTAGENAGNYPITQGSLANANYAISFVEGALTIAKAAQQITWNQKLTAGCADDMSIALTAKASSGLPVSYQSANTAVATISGDQLLIGAPGVIAITASQAGNANYLPATAIQKELLSKLPASLLVKRWDDVLVFDNSSKQYTAWQWYKNETIINGATGQYYNENGKLNGDYYAVVKTTSATTLQTCPLTVTPGNTFTPLTIFPNPIAPGQTAIAKTGYTAGELQGATIVVSNMQGVVIQTLRSITPQTNIAMPLMQGMYTIRLVLSNGVTASVNALVKP